MTDILRWMKNSTPEDCKEVAFLILEQGLKERTLQWHANIDAAIEEQDAKKPLESQAQF